MDLAAAPESPDLQELVLAAQQPAHQPLAPAPQDPAAQASAPATCALRWRRVQVSANTGPIGAQSIPAEAGLIGAQTVQHGAARLLACYLVIKLQHEPVMTRRRF